MVILSTEIFKQHQTIKKPQKTMEEQEKTTIDCCLNMSINRNIWQFLVRWSIGGLLTNSWSWLLLFVNNKKQLVKKQKTIVNNKKQLLEQW